MGKPKGLPKTGGRGKGSQNKATIEFKEALNKLMDHAAPDLVEWLGEIDDPFKRFEVLSKFAEYIHPKLARTDIQNLDKDGKPADSISKIVIEHVTAKKS
jgi:hypothetical protein